MPDRGLLERPTAVESPAGPHAEGAAWALKGVRLAQITFEVAREAALGRIPTDVSRPVPCYARLIVIETAVSPAGAFKLAGLFVGGRYRMMPRNVLVEGIVEGPMDEVSHALGNPFRAGSVAMSRKGGAVETTVAAEEGELARLTLPGLAAVDPAMLRWDPWLAFAKNDGAVNLVECSLQPSASEAFLSKGATLETPASLERSHPWRQMRNINTVSACYLEGDLNLVLPQVQQALP